MSAFGSPPAAAAPPSRLWVTLHSSTVLCTALMLPLVWVLCIDLWRVPYGIGETVAILEDLQNKSFAELMHVDGTYVRPGFWFVLWLMWQGPERVLEALTVYKAVHLASVLTLLVLFAGRLRLSGHLDAAAAIVAVTVLIGSGGFRENLENLPLNPMMFIMSAAIISWSLAERPAHAARSTTLVLIAMATLALKEQGLVVVAVILAARWAGAPGVTRAATWLLCVVGAGYLSMRLLGASSWPTFEQAIGVGTEVLEPAAAADRFGSLPLKIYAYNVAATGANVLFGEPSSGVFRILPALSRGTAAAWQVNQLFALTGMTMMLAAWAGSLWRSPAAGAERRLVVMFLAALLVSAALGFNYTRDRFGGVAVVFYAACAFHATRWALPHALRARPRRALVIATGVFLLSTGWQLRAAGTLEMAEERSWSIRKEWLIDIPERRQRFHDRPQYLRFMDALYPQGSDPRAVPSERPRWIGRLLGS